jgi:cobalt-zinc-cadmium efflux system membrane fusion protein
MCSAKAADDFKAKDDWCDEHNRAESQCFICDPSRAEKFAALYEAKFGEKPPKPTE